MIFPLNQSRFVCGVLSRCMCGLDCSRSFSMGRWQERGISLTIWKRRLKTNHCAACCFRGIGRSLLTFWFRAKPDLHTDGGGTDVLFSKVRSTNTAPPEIQNRSRCCPRVARALAPRSCLGQDIADTHARETSVATPRDRPAS